MLRLANFKIFPIPPAKQKQNQNKAKNKTQGLINQSNSHEHLKQMSETLLDFCL